MKEYYLDEIDLVKAVIFPTAEYIISLVMDENKEFEIFRDCKTMSIIVRVNNKPRNSPVYNLFWRELG